MRTFKLIMSLFVVMLFSASCIDDTAFVRDRMVLLYLDGNNNLSSDAQRNIDSLLLGFLPSDKIGSDAVLVYLHRENQQPTLTSYSRNSDGEVVSTLVSVYDNSTVSIDPAFMKRVISDARMVFPAKKYGLVLWSHGSGWLPENYHGYPKDMAEKIDYLIPGSDKFNVKGDDAKSFGMEHYGGHYHEMDIKLLSNALTNDYEFIIFDCCLMSCVEVAYELRNNSKYIIASPTEIMTTGFPYSHIMNSLFNESNIENALGAICKSYYDSYVNNPSEPWATIALVRTDYLEQLAQVSRMIFANHRSEIATLNPKSIQQYDRNDRCWFNDFDDFVNHIASDEEYEEFSKILKAAVPVNYATEKFISIPIFHSCGLSTYIPNPKYSILNEYYMSLDWNIATGLLQ